MTAATKHSAIDINMILALPTKELDDLIQEIRNQTREREEERIRAAIAEHDEQIGKCFKARVEPHYGIFPEMWRYYKIISARAESEYHVSALTFDEYPTYWFDYHTSKAGRAGDYFFGDYEFDGIQVIDIPFYCNNIFANGEERKEEGIVGNFVGKTLTEISLEEYNAAMNLYIARLQKMDWPPDHYRFGNKLPDDPDWRVKPNEHSES